MDQEWGGHKGLFEGMEGLCGGRSPGERFGFVTEETGERAGDGTEVLNEPSIEVGKAKESL